MHVEPGGALILQDGRAVVLEGIRLPEDDDGAPSALAARARAVLGDLARQPVRFVFADPTMDRYGRLRAQVFAGAAWLQVALLEQGLARVAIAPDGGGCASQLYAAEARARWGRAGLWNIAAYRPRDPWHMTGTAGTFQIVEGRVGNVGNGGGRWFLDFGKDGQRAFSVVIAPENRRAFRGFDLDGLAGKRIRIRGVVQDYRGRTEIALANPAQIEILD
ncbi:MAG TPA: thermonuclease family protein [Rhizomicrobium sp.]|nr:thermonuclease family protein [Rhizomicrobium sp.]